ncbi:hypothetical protein EXT70_15495 [Dickeya dadantii]|nr:hypothetical protein [Dickeya dadantii]
MNDFVRNKRCPFFATSSHARQGEAQTPPLLDHWLVAKLWRYALLSAFDFAVRAARDALHARRGLSRLPCRSPGEVVHLSTVFDARKNHSPIIKVFVSNLPDGIFLLFRTNRWGIL